MSIPVLHLRGVRLRWHTRLTLVSAFVVALAVLVSAAGLAPMVVTTVVALVAATCFVLGVSASISAFLDRESYADSDFWR